MAKIVFKELTSNQNVLFPVSLSEKIAPNHPVRVVNSVVDALDISCLLWAYKGGGTSSYHPRMMLKVLFYAYLNNIYSCRKIEKALQENIHFMWLSGNSTPDFRTINDFRGKRLKEHIKSLFSSAARIRLCQFGCTVYRWHQSGIGIQPLHFCLAWQRGEEQGQTGVENTGNP